MMLMKIIGDDKRRLMVNKVVDIDGVVNIVGVDLSTWVPFGLHICNVMDK
jgi:hypothetical protein